MSDKYICDNPECNACGRCLDMVALSRRPATSLSAEEEKAMADAEKDWGSMDASPIRKQLKTLAACVQRLAAPADGGPKCRLCNGDGWFRDDESRQIVKCPMCATPRRDEAVIVQAAKNYTQAIKDHAGDPCVCLKTWQQECGTCRARQLLAALAKAGGKA